MKNRTQTSLIRNQHLRPLRTHVQTRAATPRNIHPVLLLHLEPMSINSQYFSDLQGSCPTLAFLRNQGYTCKEKFSRGGSAFVYEVYDGLLYGLCSFSHCRDQPDKTYLVVPTKFRRRVLSVTHENSLACHFSHRKTGTKVVEQFYRSCTYAV